MELRNILSSKFVLYISYMKIAVGYLKPVRLSEEISSMWIKQEEENKIKGRERPGKEGRRELKKRSEEEKESPCVGLCSLFKKYNSMVTAEWGDIIILYKILRTSPKCSEVFSPVNTIWEMIRNDYCRSLQD